MPENTESTAPLMSPTRISDIVQLWAARLHDHPAIVEASGCWTYGQLNSLIDKTRDWLVNLDVRPGDRVMLVCENCREFVVILFALSGLDAWPVLVNAHLSAREVDEIRDHSGARRIIYTISVSPHAEEHAKRHRAVKSELMGFGSVAVGPLNEETEPEPINDDLSDRVAALIYTSGTTGRPKGVMLTHRNLLFMAEGSAHLRSLIPGDRLYGVLPMSHAVGLSVVLLGSLFAGATLYITPRFDPITARVALEKDQLTILLGTPAMFNQLLQYAKLRKITSLKFPALRTISSSGGPLHLSTKIDIENLFGMVLHNGYGITECSPTIAVTRIQFPRKDTSIGIVFPGVEIRLIGSDGKQVAGSEAGELWIRGPNIMKGYYRAPEETAEAVNSEGWFNSRDLARMEDGNLFIVGRTKDLIVHRGFNVYPAEVEVVLNAHPEIVQSAVVGRSAGGDEEVVAFIQPVVDSKLTVADVAEYAACNLAPYKRPSHILFVSAMPMTPTGKIIKGQLAEMAKVTANTVFAR